MLSVKNAKKPHKIVEVHCDGVGGAIQEAGGNLPASFQFVLDECWWHMYSCVPKEAGNLIKYLHTKRND